VGWGRRGSEELRFPCPGGELCPAPRGVLAVVLREARLTRLRRAPSADPGGTHPLSEEVGRCPGWNRVRGAPKNAAYTMPGTERTMLIKTPVALPREAGSPCPFGRGDGCARKRCRCDDAPIRRSGPPRHRAHYAVGGRSSRLCRVKLPCECRCRSADAAVGNRTFRRSRLTPADRAGGSPASRPKATVRCP
jgi:hypothetical protein